MKDLSIINSRISLSGILVSTLFILVQFISINSSAQDEKKAEIKLSFDQNDSTRFCKAMVTADNKPVAEIEVHFYVQRMYSLLPIGKAIETDSNGEAVANFPLDLPGDKNGNIVAIAKIEDDDNYGTVEARSEVKWGILPNNEADVWNNRSLSASRDKAPMILIIVSNLIIAFIWGTILYVVFQIFRIRKESQMLKTKND
jgi:hypothetical protein